MVLLFSPFVRRAKSATGYRGLACHTGPAKVSMVSLLLSVAWLITGVEKSLDTARTSACATLVARYTSYSTTSNGTCGDDAVGGVGRFEFPQSRSQRQARRLSSGMPPGLQGCPFGEFGDVDGAGIGLRIAGLSIQQADFDGHLRQGPCGLGCAASGCGLVRTLCVQQRFRRLPGSRLRCRTS